MTREDRMVIPARQITVAVLTVLLSGAVAATARAQVSSAELRGQVTDSSGAVLPGVVVRAVHADTGVSRETVSSDRGSYILQALAVGRYTVTADLPGFTAAKRDNMMLAVGQQGTLDLQLQLGGIQEQVTVAGGAPLVEVTKSDISSNLDMKQIEGLPLVGRDWLSMAVLAPGVRSTTTGVPSSGAQGNQRTKILVDGNQINRNFNFGQGTNFEFSQEAIREVLVVSNRMSAEFARAGGGVVSAVTKSGTNTLNGSVYGFFRDGKLTAKDWFTGIKEPFKNKVSGFTIGGPLVKNKLFYFGNMELTRRTQTSTFGTGIKELDVTYPIDFNRDVMFGKIDYQVSAAHNISGRVGHDKNRRLFQTASPGLSAGWHVPQVGKFAGVTVTSVFGPRTVNEFTYQFFPFEWGRDQTNTAPGFIFPAARLGTSNNALAFGMKEDMTFLRNTLTHSAGNHNIKTGVELVYVDNSGSFGDIYYGNFLIPGNPTSWGPVLDAVKANDMVALQRLMDQGVFPVPTSATFGVGDPSFSTPQPLFGVFIQDDWRIGPKFTLNLGVRYDLDTGAFITDLDTRYTRDYGKPVTDVNNIAPRVGFAWSLTEKDRSVIRGGAGRYFDSVHNNFTFAAQIFNGDTYAQITTFPGQPARPNYIVDPLGGVTLQSIVANPKLAAQNIRPFSKDFVTSYTDQFAIGLAHQLTDQLAFQADVLHIRGRNEGYYVDSNLFCDAATGDPKPVRTFGRPDPVYNVIRSASSGGKSRYDGLQLGANKRFSDNYQFGASYTLSWSHSNSGGNSQTNIPDPCNLDGLYALSAEDQRHRGTFNMVYQFPWDIHVSGVVIAASGQRYLTNAGRDLNGDLENNDLARNPDGSKMPWAGAIGDPVLRVDMRASKIIHLVRRAKVEVIAEALNLFNRKNYNIYNGNQASPAFRRPSRSQDLNFQPFQAQLAFRFTF